MKVNLCSCPSRAAELRHYWKLDLRFSRRTLFFEVCTLACYGLSVFCRLAACPSSEDMA